MDTREYAEDQGDEGDEKEDTTGSDVLHIARHTVYHDVVRCEVMAVLQEIHGIQKPRMQSGVHA